MGCAEGVPAMEGYWCTEVLAGGTKRALEAAEEVVG